MKTLSIDIETYSSVSLKDAGVYAYAEAADFEILLFGYAWDDGPVQVVDLTRQTGAVQTGMFDEHADTLPEIPADVIAAITDPAVLKTAFNANFERVCLAQHFGYEMPPEQWECSMVRAAEAGLPRSLKGAGAAGRDLGIAEDMRKDWAAGNRLIQFFCVPCRATKANGGRTRNLPQHDPERWREFIEYNRQDVVAERAVRNALPPIIDSERHLWALDQRINDRGVMIDRELVDNMVELDDAMRRELMDEALKLTRIDNPNSRNQVLRWINQKTGLHFENFRKQDLPEILAATDDSDVHRMIEIRQRLGKTSTQKYRAMQSAVCSDGRIRGLTAFYGAPRTGRWSGRLVQLQNLPRNYLSDLDSPRDLVRSGEGDMLGLLYDNPADVMSQLIRTALVPKPGCVFKVVDFSAIEARVIAWAAQEDWVTEVFRTHGKIYEATAAQMFHVPMECIARGNPEYKYRQIGKVAQLALGYQGGVGALTNMRDGLGIRPEDLPEEDMPGIVQMWRDANPHITRLWRMTEETARAVLRLPEGSDMYRSIRTTGGAEIRFYHDKACLRIQLPSGRSLRYSHAHVQSREAWGWSTDGIVYDGTGDEAAAVPTYGGKLVENLVQAIARDCLAEALMRVAAADLNIVFHVHDEIIIEARPEEITVDQMAGLMSQPFSWAPGLPLAAAGYECNYYKKD